MCNNVPSHPPEAFSPYKPQTNNSPGGQKSTHACNDVTEIKHQPQHKILSQKQCHVVNSVSADRRGTKTAETHIHHLINN